MAIINAYYLIHTKKRGACSVARFTCRGSGIAQFVETSNAESPTPDVPYIETIDGVGKITNTKEGCIEYIP